MAHVRYCAPVYLAGKVRVKESEPESQELKQLQVLQNKMLRTALRKE